MPKSSRSRRPPPAHDNTVIIVRLGADDFAKKQVHCPSNHNCHGPERHRLEIVNLLQCLAAWEVPMEYVVPILFITAVFFAVTNHCCARTLQGKYAAAA